MQIRLRNAYTSTDIVSVLGLFEIIRISYVPASEFMRLHVSIKIKTNIKLNRYQLLLRTKFSQIDPYRYLLIILFKVHHSQVATQLRTVLLGQHQLKSKTCQALLIVYKLFTKLQFDYDYTNIRYMSQQKKKLFVFYSVVIPQKRVLQTLRGVPLFGSDFS